MVGRLNPKYVTQLPIPVSNGGTGDTGTVWNTSFTPNVTAGSGAFTSVSATCRYKTLGKTVFLQIEVNIATNGTAGSFIQVSLPTGTQTGIIYPMAGRYSGGTSVTAALLNGNAVLTKYDATYPGADNRLIEITGVYESS